MRTEQPLKFFFKGTVLVVIGTVLGMGFEFLTRLLIIRSSSPAEYGTFALGYAVFSISTLIATLGFQEGLSRQAAYLIGKGRTSEANHASWSALWIVILWGVALAGLGYAFSGVLAAAFRNPALAEVFRILFVAMPFFAVVITISAAFRGAGNVTAKVLLQDFLLNAMKLAAVSVLILAGGSFLGVITGYAAIYPLIGVVAFLFFAKRFSRGSGSSKKELLITSLPLLGISLFYLGIMWSDTIILGLLKGAAEAGLYTGAADVGRVLRTAMLSSVFVYAPIAANLFGRGNVRELKIVYVTVTKWLLLVSVPAGMLMMMFPHAVLKVLYGAEYAEAAATLSVITLGLLISIAFGPAGSTLVAMGRSRHALAAFFSGFAINVILNLILIPPYGIIGAAIASAVSFSIVAFMLVIMVQKIIKVRTFARNHVSIVLIGASLGAVFYVVIRHVLGLHSSIPAVMVVSVVYFALYVVLLILTKSFDDHDLMLLDIIERRLKVDLSAVKGFLKNSNKKPVRRK